MNCPKCNSVRLIVTDSRPSTENMIRRRRECVMCKYRFTTYEITEKEKGRLEQADRTASGLKKGIKDIIHEYA